MKTIYLHIGTKKTGTKSIQYFLSTNSKLLSKNNMYYPTGREKPFVHHFTHWPLAAAVTDTNSFVANEKLIDYTEMYSLLKDEIDNVKEQNIILSAEPFSVNVINLDDIKKIKESLLGYNVKIIIYLRRQDNYFVSLTSTNVKGGQFFENYEFNHIEVFKNKDRYDYNVLLEKWATVFGKDNMIVREYESKKFVNGNIVDDFCSLVGIKNKTFLKIKKKSKKSDKRNRSLSLECLYFLNDFNRANLLDASKRTKVFVSLENYEGKKNIKYILDTKMRREIRDFYRNSNDLVCKNYFNNTQLFDWSDLDKVENYQLTENVCFDDYIKIMNFLMKSDKASQIMIEHYVNSLETIKTLESNFKMTSASSILFSMRDKPQYWSEDITNIEYNNDVLIINSSGTDPYFIFDNFSNEKSKSLEINIEIQTQIESFVQVFYTSENEGFSPEKTAMVLINPYIKKYQIIIDDDNIIKNLRFDIGDTMGEYKIKEIEIYGK